MSSDTPPAVPPSASPDTPPVPGQVARRTVSGEVIEWLDVPARAEALGLEPHPEGGWYRRTWTSPITVPFGDSTRPGATLIHFLLPPGEASAWHRVESDEIWLWHGPDPLVLELGGHGESPVSPSDDESTQEQPDVFRILLGGGAGTLLGEAAQGLIPGGVWQRTLPSDGETLVSCVVSPGFSFDDFTLAE